MGHAIFIIIHLILISFVGSMITALLVITIPLHIIYFAIQNQTTKIYSAIQGKSADNKEIKTEKPKEYQPTEAEHTRLNELLT